MGITPLTFTGVSSFSDDFQTILNRAVAIANLPVQGLQNDQATLLSKKQQLSDLGDSVQSLASTMTTLADMGVTRALSGSSSNTGLITVQSVMVDQPGVYTISDITSLAAAASETTLSGYATPDSTTVSAGGALELVFGSTTKSITLATDKNNLNGLRDAINALGLGLNATVLNTGSGDNPYYLSVSSVATGETVLQLRTTAGDAGSNLLTSLNQGSNAEFKLNGLAVRKSTNQIKDVIPGVTFTVAGKTAAGQTVNLTLASSGSKLANALQELAANYNKLSGKLEAQVGETAGVLGGDYVIRELQEALRSLAGYEGTGAITRLADLGIEFDAEGAMSFNSDVFNSLTPEQLEGAFDFLGSATTGFGALAARFTQFTDPYSGLIGTQQRYYDEADQRISGQISSITDRVNLMQTTLSAKLQLADTLLAQLESQQTLLDASVKSLEYSLYGRKDG